MRRSFTLGLAVAAAGLAAVPAHASTITVTSLADSGAGTLRNAVNNANAGDTIVVPAGTISVASPLVVDVGVTISGAGSGQTTVSGDGTHRVFTVNGAIATISDLRITGGGGGGSDEDGFGGGLLAEGSSALTLRHVRVDHNVITRTGSALAVGGGVAATDTSSLTVKASSFDANSVTAAGGIAYGGALASNTSAGQLTVADSTFTANGAHTTGGGGAYGGAIAQRSITQTTALRDQLVGLTLSANSALRDSGSADAAGGNLAHLDVPSLPGGYTQKALHTMDTIIANGTSTTSGKGDCGGDTSVQGGSDQNAAYDGHNVITAPGSQCSAGAPGNVTGDPKLGTLSNGVLVPQAGSPVLGAAAAYPTAICTLGTSGCVDERGVPRKATPDVGAVELHPADATAPVGPTDNGSSDTTSATFSATVTTYGQDATYQFSYGPHGSDPASFTMLAAHPFRNDDGDQVSEAVSGLAPNVTYDVRIVVTSPDGTTSATGTYATHASAPTATITGAAPTDTSVTINGTVGAGRLASTVHFDLSGDNFASFVSTPDQAVGSIFTNFGVFAMVGGLTPGHTYLARMVATNAAGRTVSAPLAFTTAPATGDLGSLGTPSGSFTPFSVKGIKLGAAHVKTGHAGAVRLTIAGSSPATVTAVLTRIVTGALRRGHCGTAPKHGRYVKCTRHLAVSGGTITTLLKPGAATLTIPARLKGHKLTPGTYRVAVHASATVAGQKTTTKTTTLTLTVTH